MFTIPEIEDSIYTIHKKKTGTLHGCLEAMNLKQLSEICEVYIDLDDKEPASKSEYVHFLEERIPLLSETYFNFQMLLCFLFYVSLIFQDEKIYETFSKEAEMFNLSEEQQTIITKTYAKKLIHDGMLFHFITAEGKNEFVIPKELKEKISILLSNQSSVFIPGKLPEFPTLCHALTDLYCIVTPEILQTICQNFYGKKISKKDMLHFMKDAALVDGNTYFYKKTLCTFDVDNIDWLFDTIIEERKNYSPFIPSNEEITSIIERYNSKFILEYDEDNPAYKKFVEFIKNHTDDDFPEEIASEIFFYIKMNFRLQEIVNSLSEDYNIVFENAEDINNFVKNYQNLVNTSHLWVNWGNTPESFYENKKQSLEAVPQNHFSSIRNSEFDRTTISPVQPFPKVGRNDPCPCGSGLKYKKCHGR